MMVPFIDIHTHQPSNRRDLIEIVNTLPFHAPQEKVRFYSAGVHPWYIDATGEAEYRHWLNRLLIDKRCLMLGEAGLDGCCHTDESIQKQFFEWQTTLAAELNKPVIIHCVRRYNEVLALSNRSRTHTPWILHGYQSSVGMAAHLLKRNFFFSFGSALLMANERLEAVMNEIPADRLFLETDDSGVAIEQIYQSAAMLLNKDVNELKILIFNNFNRMFHVDRLA